MTASSEAIDALEAELLGLVAETASAPVAQLLQVQVEQVRLTEPTLRGAGSPEPQLPPPLTSKILGSRVIGSPNATPEELKRPCLFDALEFHPFAQRWIAWRRASGRPCSAAWLADQMRVGETLANDLSTGRARPKPRHVPGLVRAYGLTPKEATFLEGIARHELATDLEDKARQRMALLRYAVDQGARHPVGERWRVAAHWGPRAIWGLSTLTGFWANPIWISLALRGRLPVAQAKDMLQTLIYTGLLVPAGEGVLRVAEPTIQLTPPDQEVADFALHDSVLDLLRQEVLVAAPDQRFLALNLMLPAEAVPRAFAMGEGFRDRMLSIIAAAQLRVEAGESPPCALMLTATQIFPGSCPFQPTIRRARRRS